MKYIPALLLSLALFSCASQPTEQAALNQSVREQQPADTPEQIAGRAAMAFSNAEGLTAEQKLQLSHIYSRVYSDSMKIQREIGKSKSLLFMTLAKVDYRSSEIENLKRKIVKLDQQRLNLMFAALADVQAIVGRGVEKEKIYKYLRDYNGPRASNIEQ